MRRSGLVVCCLLLGCGTLEPTVPPPAAEHVDQVEAPEKKAAAATADPYLIAMDDELKKFIMESQGPIESRAVEVFGRATVMRLLAVLAARNRCLY